MSESIKIKKSIDIEIDVQIDYVKCDECGDELDFIVSCDSFGDLQISVGKCNCDQA